MPEAGKKKVLVSMPMLITQPTSQSTLLCSHMIPCKRKRKKKRKKRERKRALLVGFISQYLLLQPGCFQPQNGGTYALSWTQGWGGAYLYSALLCKEARYPNGQEHGLWSQNPSSDTYYQYGLGQVNFSSPQFANLQGGARLSTKASHVL